MMLLITALLIAVCSQLVSAKHSVTATGCVLCYDEPMKQVKVTLKDEDLKFDDTIDVGQTNDDGCFSLSGSGGDIFHDKPDLYIEIEYYYSGKYGKMEVENPIGVNRKQKTSVQKNTKGLVKFGIHDIHNIHCKAYMKFQAAMEEYYHRTGGLALPYSLLHIRTGTIVHGGTAYSTTDRVRIPHTYKPSDVNMELARHELAHTIRHSFDGSFPHFLWDVARLHYMRHHHCGLNSNAGYAFNEGWAEYWADECHGDYGHNDNVEGSVAQSLRMLKDLHSHNEGACSSWRKMVTVLKMYRKKIHSFTDFNQKHKQLYNCGL